MRTARLEPLEPTVGKPCLEPTDECPDPAPELVQRIEHKFKVPSKITTHEPSWRSPQHSDRFYHGVLLFPRQILMSRVHCTTPPRACSPGQGFKFMSGTAASHCNMALTESVAFDPEGQLDL
jgi:hypothetical protein